eukprot:9469754-Pyramimonas_sp.AAC.1
MYNFVAEARAHPELKAGHAEETMILKSCAHATVCSSTEALQFAAGDAGRAATGSVLSVGLSW